MEEGIDYTLLFIEDQEVLREGTIKTLGRLFSDFRKNDFLSPYVPNNIHSYENLDLLLEQELPDENTFYSWITDWNVSEKNTKYLETTSALYTGLATYLGLYNHILTSYDFTEQEELLLLEEYKKLQSLGEKKIKTLNELLKNTGSLFIHTAYPGEALFHKDVEISFSYTGSKNSPLVLYQEKSVILDKDVKQLAAGVIFTAKAYEGRLPIIGNNKNLYSNKLRSTLTNKKAINYTMANKISNNRLEDFLKEVSKNNGE